MKLLKMLIFFPMALSLITLSLSYINGLGCDYEMQLPAENGVESIAVCRMGRINVVETDINTNDQWVINAINFNIGNQIYMFVTNRYQSNDGLPFKVSYLDRFNKSHDGIVMYHYAWVLVDSNNVILFQKIPKDEIYMAKINGVIDLWMAIFGYEYQKNKPVVVN
ncbi:hypothetical protein GL272_14090 [Aeromonas veronii]|uniref:hypothetical protein n=1 Tax=Aeromonas veronii TaxID=654 RepID=UPI00130289F0|nr:hypothetical protein [Aeromonas veronii]KAE9625313.1 hypothetical protein GO627_07920 [Aeromonas veronii]MBW3778036.1 hypothetical protein [Aeromonas veronii]